MNKIKCKSLNEDMPLDTFMHSIGFVQLVEKYLGYQM